jgi:hypothetical protein
MREDTYSSEELQISWEEKKRERERQTDRQTEGGKEGSTLKQQTR